MLQIKKSVFVGILVVCSLVFGAIGVGAANGIEKITASLNKNIKFTVDGEKWTPKDSDGNKLSPIIYDGSTYLPVKAVGQAFNSTVNWVSSTQTIEISTGNSGIPYKDAEVSDTKETTKNDSGSSSSGNGVMVLSGTKDQMTEKMKKQAVEVIKLYGQALESGSPDPVLDYIDQYVALEDDDTPIYTGREYYKDKFEKFLKGTLAVNEEDVIADYADTLQNVKLADVEISYISEKSEYSQSFQFKYYPAEWNAFSSVYVYFTFKPIQYDSQNFVLSEVSIN